MRISVGVETARHVLPTRKAPPVAMAGSAGTCHAIAYFQHYLLRQERDGSVPSSGDKGYQIQQRRERGLSI